MAKQSLLWTALPNGYSQDGKSLRVSLLLSPRLDPEADPLDPTIVEQLATFPDFVDWPATLTRTKFVIHFGADSVTIDGNQTTGKNRVDDSLGMADSGVWSALFPDTTYVKGYKFRDLSNHSVLSFQAATIENLVSDLYTQLAASAEDHLPKISTIIGDPKWQGVLNAVAHNDERFTDRKTHNDYKDQRAGLRDTVKQFAAFKDGFKGLSGIDRDLALFQLFHTPPSTPTVAKYPQPPDPKSDPAKAEARWRTYERAQLPAANEFQDKIDFHQIVTAMNQYPTLLRKLGLVVDLLIQRKAFNLSPNALLFAEVHLPAGSPNVNRTQDVSPRSHTLLDTSNFRPVTSPIPALGKYSVVNGLLHLNPSLFKLMQADVDGAGIKVMNFARTLLLHRNAPETQRDPVTRHERETGAPALRNAGLMLVHSFRAEMLKNSFARQKLFNDRAVAIQAGSPQPPPTLYAEDLVRGFRIDIWDSKTEEWRSLCKREADYDINDGEVGINVSEEEGMVRLAATTTPDKASNPDIVWLHETLVSWTGWSLCAPPPGKTISHDEDDHTDPVTEPEAEVPPGLRLQTAFTARPGSLPRLRYGRKYWIRARVVDLAGNSLPLSRGDFGTEQSDKNAQSYLRYEPISAPAIALVKPDADSVEEPEEGESMERMAVRSFNVTESDNSVTATQIARRFAVPSRTSQREAEHHGMLDRAGIVDPAFFAMLAAKDNSLAKEVILMAGPLAEIPPVETSFAVMEEGQELPYLPEPLAVVIAARIFDHPGFPSDAIIEIPLYDTASEWPDAAPFKIKLVEDPVVKPHFDKTTRTLLIPLPKAERATLRLSVKPADEETLKLLGVWNWLTKSPLWNSLTVKQRNVLKKMAMDGQHWMLTPWRNIELVHAVQKPLITPEIIKHTVNRSLNKTHALPNFIVTCSIKSTDHLDVLAQWNEPDGDANEQIGQNRARTDHAFTVKITDDKSYAGNHEYQLLSPDVISAGGLFHDRISVKVHEFNDTRYRRIEYWFDATTKFREFMPASLLTEEVASKTVPTDKNIKVTGAKLRTWIPSSASPPAPEVLYVVPTFGWVRSFDQANKSSWRRGGGLRVYLNRPWNVSGYGEMLAVVLPSAAFSGDPNTDPNPNVDPKNKPLKNFVTQWGNDPIWLSPFVTGSLPNPNNFPLARTAPDPTGRWLPSFGPAEEADQPPAPFITTGLRHPELSPNAKAQSLVAIAPHDVFYDEERQLWYCDIEVNWGTAYYPFIRLALARYQPVSLQGMHLSNIVLADFMPLVPDRWLNVTQTLEPRTKHVSVYGFTYTDSSSHTEATSALNVAPSSVIEIWVERFDPAWGEDFGWRREPDAFVQRGVRLSELLVTTTKVTVAKQRARAKSLLQEREYTALIEEGLIDKIFITPTLWDGSVTLPHAREGLTRYRLVIAEYEEYLVDDAQPYDPPPTKKDRRLVFVEYVELS